MFRVSVLTALLVAVALTAADAQAGIFRRRGHSTATTTYYSTPPAYAAPQMYAPVVPCPFVIDGPVITGTADAGTATTADAGTKSDAPKS